MTARTPLLAALADVEHAFLRSVEAQAQKEDARPRRASRPARQSPLETALDRAEGQRGLLLAWHLFWGPRLFAELSRLTPGIPTPTLRQDLQALETGGLVERRPDPGDRRVRGLHLTRKGRGVLDKAGVIAIDYETRLCAGINREEREQLIDLLQKLQESQTHLRGVHPGLGND